MCAGIVCAAVSDWTPFYAAHAESCCNFNVDRTTGPELGRSVLIQVVSGCRTMKAGSVECCDEKRPGQLYLHCSHPATHWAITSAHRGEEGRGDLVYQ